MKTLFLIAFLVFSASADAVCNKSTQSVKNKDQSVLRLTEETCDGQAGRSISLQIVRANERNPATLIEKSVPKTVRFLDLETDGTFELEELGSCVGLPGCESVVYKLSSDRASMKPYFQGPYAEISVVEGFLVGSDRASCCSWEHFLYRAESGKIPITASDAVYRVTVQSPDSLGYAACQFSQRGPGGRGWRPAKIPSPGLKKLCESYGKKYQVNS